MKQAFRGGKASNDGGREASSGSYFVSFGALLVLIRLSVALYSIYELQI